MDSVPAEIPEIKSPQSPWLEYNSESYLEVKEGGEGPDGDAPA